MARPVPHSVRLPSRTSIRWEKTTAVAVKIKLKRMGKIREPYYRIVVADARTKRDGRAIEEIGKYHPKAEPSLIEVDSDRAQHWLSVGAQPTDPVRKLLEVTGDWQKFKGLPGAEGTLKTAAPRSDKKEIFAAALAETLAASEAAPKGRAKAGGARAGDGKAADAKAGDGKAADAKAGESKSGKADRPARGARSHEGKAEAGKAEAGKAEAGSPEEAAADASAESGSGD
jgi:small subunit ribosomal protein S16